MTDTSRQETGGNTGARDPADPLPGRSWWHRTMEPEERRRIMTDLAIVRIEHWTYRFAIMLTLSVVVAVMGLSLNSAAVVIGAMLLAPLMQPVLASGACLAMALFTKSLVAVAKVALATTWCIAIAYAISWILPVQELTPEVLARTQPDLKDLVVALAAGAAGAYATVRSDVSSSLPGVAVAVALVPPLASVGILLQQGFETRAQGALLLYIANLAAIVVASIVVFITTGFVPPRRLSDNLARLTLASVAVVAVVVVIAVPLYRTALTNIERQDDEQAARDIVANWLGDLNDDLDPEISVSRDAMQVVVELRGFEDPPDKASLVEAMRQEFPEFDVPVQFLKFNQATTTTLPPPEPTERLLADIRVTVERWLNERDLDHRLEDVTLDGDQVRIEVASTDQPPPIEELVTRLQAVNPALSPELAWSELRTITEEAEPSPDEITAESMRTLVDRWAIDRNLVITGFDYDGNRVLIDVSGTEAPDYRELEVALWDEADQAVPVQVFFTERALVTTTTSRPTATPR